MEELSNRDDLIKTWIKEAVETIQAQEKKERIVEEKTNRTDLVTDMDKNTERFFVEKIKETFPGERVFGEEGYGDDVNDLEGIVWFLDPIDGTLNYVLQEENFAVMLGVYEDGEGMLGYIYNMNEDSLYSAVKGKGIFKDGEPLSVSEDKALSDGVIESSSLLMTDDRFAKHRKVADQALGVRVIGSAGLEVLQVIKGNAVGYMAASLSPWDIAPGKVMLDEAGILCTRFDGQEVNLLEKNRTLIAYPSAHKEIKAILNGN